MNINMYSVMIVDDDRTNLAISKALLEPNYNIILMKSGVQALGYLKSNPAPELILLDFSMPATSGTDVLKALQADERYKDIPVIFLTSSSDDKLMIVQGLLSGAADSIDKPVNPDLLRKKVNDQIEILQAVRENQSMRKRIAELENVIRQCTFLLEGTVVPSMPSPATGIRT